MNANMNPFDVDYIEMHGTGTKLGYSIEEYAVAEPRKGQKEP